MHLGYYILEIRFVSNDFRMMVNSGAVNCILSAYLCCQNAKLRVISIKLFSTDVSCQSDLFRRQHPPLLEPRPRSQLLFTNPAEELGLNKSGATISSG